ncbi:hypothetical protein J3458_020406 [Metarhizium acridum]|uniref:uncharacterized protein n=1 Tax=Metarhizium acridum TaxID=92637 RepID=UPI001C6BB675|nr:hypothetical protein J3458_020406 [Metarhizium acridum]
MLSKSPAELMHVLSCAVFSHPHHLIFPFNLVHCPLHFPIFVFLSFSVQYHVPLFDLLVTLRSLLQLRITGKCLGFPPVSRSKHSYTELQNVKGPGLGQAAFPLVFSFSFASFLLSLVLQTVI